MRSSAAQSIYWRPNGRHALAAGVAVVVSLSLHAVVLETFPNLPMGRVPDFSGDERLPSVHVDQVRREALEALDRPTPFSPSDPAEFVDVKVGQQRFQEALDDVIPPEPELSVEQLVGDLVPVAPPEPVIDRTMWEPRQDILAIEKDLFPEAMATLPRHYIDDVPRVYAAPDIVLPVELSPGDLVPDKLPTTGSGIKMAGLPGLEQLLTAARTQLSDRAVIAPPLREKEMGLLDEVAAEITDIQPVEQLLGLDVYTFRPPEADGYNYFELHIHPYKADSLPVIPKDVILIQDCSESMTQTKLNYCKRGLKDWLAQLDPGDRFDIMGFREDPYLCFNEWTPVSATSLARANWFIANMDARGKTDVLKSLRALLALKKEADRPVLAILVTDGRPTRGIVDSSDIIEQFTRSNGAAFSVFSFGGGTSVNRYLLDLLSYRNRGDSRVVEGRRDIPGSLAEWAKELDRPVLTSLSYRFAGIDAAEIYPNTLTHLYLDRPLVIYGRVPVGTQNVAFQVVGHSGGAKRDMVFKIDWAGAKPGADRIRTQWAWHKIYHLIGKHIETDNAQFMDQIQVLANQHGFFVPYADDIPRRSY